MQIINKNIYEIISTKFWKDIDISSDSVYDYNGIWKNGDLFGGTWFDGTWERGTWQDGLWVTGLWKTGIWFESKAIWLNGTWQEGRIFRKGKEFVRIRMSPKAFWRPKRTLSLNYAKYQNG